MLDIKWDTLGIVGLFGEKADLLFLHCVSCFSNGHIGIVPNFMLEEFVAHRIYRLLNLPLHGFKHQSLLSCFMLLVDFDSLSIQVRFVHIVVVYMLRSWVYWRHYTLFQNVQVIRFFFILRRRRLLSKRVSTFALIHKEIFHSRFDRLCHLRNDHRLSITFIRVSNQQLVQTSMPIFS
jgi:hypothetical protein